MATNYTTKTASLKATIADIRKVNAYEIEVWPGNRNNILERVNLLDLIKSGDVIYDDRGGVITENDIWPNPITLENTSIVTDTKGNISINHSTEPYNTFDYSQMTDAHKTILQSAAKVIDNKVLDADGQLLMNWETAAFTNTNGSWVDSIFGGTDETKPPITEWDSDLSSLTDGSAMFAYCVNLTSFSGDLSNLTNGNTMFSNTPLESFNGDLSSLTHGNGMFSLTLLQSFSGNLSSLTDGSDMFYTIPLQSFSGDLSSLTNGSNMFYVTRLQSFSGDLPNLTNGQNMFFYTALESFSSDLSSLANGYFMFFGCTNLTSFSSDLSSLTTGTNMFSNCKLDAESVHNILHTINPNVTSGTIVIGTNIINNSAQKLEFAKICLCDSWDELNAEFTAKHWTVTWQFNGTAASSASTLALTDSTVSTALWAKLEEVTEDNKHYGYVSEEDGKHYNIYWFHETNGSTEGYEYFGSLLEACGAFGVVPKEYAESNN